MQSLYACLMTEPFYVQISYKMNVILSILGATPQKSTILTPFFVQNTKNAPINCRYSGPFFAKTRVPPRLLVKKGSKSTFFAPLLGGGSSHFLA